MKNFLSVFVFLAAVLVAFPVQATDAVRAPAYLNSGGSGTLHVVWSGLDGDDTGRAINVSRYRELTVHVYSGTYGGSTVTFEGSNDPRANPDDADNINAEWAGLTDPQGTAISKTGDGIEAVEEQPLWIRPKTAAGTAANIAVGLIARENK